MVTIIIPAVGKGQRFADAGYTKPKPLIDVCGEPMIKRVIENVTPENTEARIVVVTRAEHEVRETIGDDKSIFISLDYDTPGAVSTVLKADDFITTDPLVIANCDQLILEVDMDDFLNEMSNYDAGAMTFNSTNPHHSYIKLNMDGLASEVAEKKVISDNAVVGIYYYKNGREFVKRATEMIKKDLRVNGEFYISPVFNEYIAAKKKVGIYEISVHQKHILGTPDELNIFLDKVANKKVVL